METKSLLVKRFYTNVYINLILLVLLVVLSFLGSRFNFENSILEIIVISLAVLYFVHLLFYLIYFFLVKRLRISEIMEVLYENKKITPEKLEKAKKWNVVWYALTYFVIAIVFVINIVKHDDFSITNRH